MSFTIEKCIEGWTNSLKQLRLKTDIVFFGDSHIYYGDFASVFPDKMVCNLGLRGDSIQGMINRVDQVMLLDPGVVYLMAGINDVATSSLESFSLLYEGLIRNLLENSPQAKLIVQSVLPVNNEEFSVSCNNAQVRACNKEIVRLANIYHLHYLDLFSIYETEGVLAADKTIDGIHLNSHSYKMWYSALTPNNSWY